MLSYIRRGLQGLPNLRLLSFPKQGRNSVLITLFPWKFHLIWRFFWQYSRLMKLNFLISNHSNLFANWLLKIPSKSKKKSKKMPLQNVFVPPTNELGVVIPMIKLQWVHSPLLIHMKSKKKDRNYNPMVGIHSNGTGIRLENLSWWQRVRGLVGSAQLTHPSIPETSSYKRSCKSRVLLLSLPLKSLNRRYYALLMSKMQERKRVFWLCMRQCLEIPMRRPGRH